MGCYVCGARALYICHHCYKAICTDHARFNENISDYLCDSCALAFQQGQTDILAE